MMEENKYMVSAAETISVDYEEILRQAVAVIENARTNIARQVAVTASDMHWEIYIKSKVDRLQENFDKISQECDALKQAILRQVFE